MSNRPLILLGALLLASCGPPLAITPTPPTYSDVSNPKVGEIASAQVGDPIISASHTIAAQAIRFLGDCTFSEKHDAPGTGTVNYSVRAGTVFVQRNVSNGVPGYCGRALQSTGPLGDVPVDKCIAAGDEAVVTFPNSEMIVQSDCRLQHTRIEADAPDSMKKELLYNGRSGTTLRLSYREFVKDMARPAFTQELTYDLRDDRVIGFRGARIEVMDANNTTVRYRVLSGF